MLRTVRLKPSRALIICLVRGMAKRIPKSLMARGLVNAYRMAKVSLNYRPDWRDGQGSGWQAKLNCKRFLVCGMVKRIPTSIIVRGLVKPIVWPSRALITGLMRRMAKARDEQRNLTPKD